MLTPNDTRIMSRDDGFRNPHNLPTKVCPVCERRFTWRKKWEDDWEHVTYCSKRCRREARAPNASGSDGRDDL